MKRWKDISRGVLQHKQCSIFKLQKGIQPEMLITWQWHKPLCPFVLVSMCIMNGQVSVTIADCKTIGYAN